MAVSLATETRLWDSGARTVAGIDEVGRGALAGPVSVGLVALQRCDEWPDGLADSKQLSPRVRSAMAITVADFGCARAVGHAWPQEIDERGIVAALRLAALRALEQIEVTIDAVILDGSHDYLSATDLWDADIEVAVPPVTTVVGGDNLCVSVAAASVLAKVERDALMVQAHTKHPDYGWAGNKGYGSPPHLEALRTRGTTEWHRRSWNLPTIARSDA